MIAEKERLYNDQEFDVGEYELWKLFPIYYSAHLEVPVKSSVAFRGMWEVIAPSHDTFHTESLSQ